MGEISITTTQLRAAVRAITGIRSDELLMNDSATDWSIELENVATGQRWIIAPDGETDEVRQL